MLFTEDEIKMTNQRIKTVNDGQFSLEDLEVQWNKIALFHNAIVPIDDFVFRMFEHQIPKRKFHLKILTKKRLEYYLKPSPDQYGDAMVRLSLPQHDENFLNASNNRINQYIQDLAEHDGHYNLSIVPLDGDTPQRKGLYIPMLRTDPRLKPDMQSKFANVFLMKFDAKEECVDYFHLKSLDNTSDVKGYLKNTLQKWRNKK